MMRAIQKNGRDKTRMRFWRLAEKIRREMIVRRVG